MTLGILIKGQESSLDQLRFWKEAGFEAVSLHFWQSAQGVDWGQLAEAVAALNWTVSSLSVYGNPLGTDEGAQQTVLGWQTLMREAPRFSTALVSGFAGRLPGEPVPQSIEPWKRWLSPLLDQAETRQLRVAFETCRMGGTWKSGDWNIAYTPDAWELMEEALPGRWSLEWEPGHAILCGADPLAQIAGWIPRVAHLHGKDATFEEPRLARNGLYGKSNPGRYSLPGQGLSDWDAILNAFQAAGFQGSLDLEAPSNPKEPPATADEMIRSLTYLKGLRDQH